MYKVHTQYFIHFQSSQNVFAFGTTFSENKIIFTGNLYLSLTTMFVQGIASHVAIITVLLLIGVPTNIAVVWIHTRKNKRVAKNKFPLIFAAIDLIALLVALPLQPLYDVHVQFETSAQAIILAYQNSVLLFSLNGYLVTLLVATIDKFCAVMFPFKYRSKHPLFVKLAVVFAFGLNLFVTAALKILYYMESINRTLYILSYNFALILIFLTTITLFVGIVAKLIHNGRKLRTVGKEPSG